MTMPSAEESATALDDFRAAFGDVDTPPWVDAPDGPDPDPAVTETSASADATNAAGPEGTAEGESSSDPPEGSAAQVTEEDLQRVLSDPAVAARLRQAIQQERVTTAVQMRQLLEAEYQRKQQEEADLLLDDEEYGRRQREQEKLRPVVDQARSEAFQQAQQNFFNMAITDVWNTVPELRDMPQAEKVAYDPAAYKSYGEYIDKLVTYASDKRIAAAIDKEVDRIVEARLATERDNTRRGAPSPVGVGGPASAPRPIVDIDTMSGKDLLKAAFSAR